MDIVWYGYFEFEFIFGFSIQNLEWNQVSKLFKKLDFPSKYPYNLVIFRMPMWSFKFNFEIKNLKLNLWSKVISW
jgi:hypothetical protein